MSQEVKVPDIGEFSDVEVIEVLVQIGDTVAVEDPLITIETDKATVEVPSPASGKIADLKLKVGDKVSKDSLILLLDTAATGDQQEQVKKGQENRQEQFKKNQENQENQKNQDFIYASPVVRRLARENNIDLTKINGSGRKNRITKEDLNAPLAVSGESIIKTAGGIKEKAGPGSSKKVPLSRIKKISGKFLQSSWNTIPHVTQFEEADITELENFRQKNKNLAEKVGTKLTPLVFIMQAVVSALKKFPTFNSELTEDNSNLILKNYFNLGIAVDTPEGLVVPVVLDVDQKGLLELAVELGEISKKARDGKLKGEDMQGGCFTISSLGGIGGTCFTPIIKAPEVAILGVSRAKKQPVFINGEFVPRLMLPLSLSYDHRVIDGADGARFAAYLSQQLSDIRRILL